MRLNTAVRRISVISYPLTNKSSRRKQKMFNLFSFDCSIVHRIENNARFAFGKPSTERKKKLIGPLYMVMTITWERLMIEVMIYEPMDGERTRS